MKQLLAVAALAFVFGACKKDDDTTTTQPTLSGYKVSFEINGTKYTYSDGVGGYKDATSSTIASGSPAGVFSTFTKDANVSTEPNSISINKSGLSFSGSTCDNGTFQGFFTPGSYIYAGGLSPFGAGIVYYDDAGKGYASALGSQGGSSFIITKSKERKVGSKYYMDVSGTFECKVYPNSGTYLQIVNGSFNATYLNQ